MAADGSALDGPENGIQVCVRVRPLNLREREEGHRICVSFDDESKQVVLSAVDRNTLIQLRGQTAKGYAFDKRYGQEVTSDVLYDDAIASTVDAIFKGYNATVLAYGQTGSGKTHTMSGGTGIHGVSETGVTPRVIQHIFERVNQIRMREKTGEKTIVSAYGLELYNEELRDLAIAPCNREDVKVWDGKATSSSAIKLQERPVGKENRVVPEVIGVTDRVVNSSEELRKFYDDVMLNRSVSSTKLNDRSSRSHAIFTITVHRTMVEIMNEVDSNFKAKVRTSEFTCKLHLVDLAGSERVKRSGVTGKELKEATHINSGLLALGNVIVALSAEDGKKKSHVPYRDSKLTRLLQDSLGGNSLTVLISCISPSEMDFEETNNTLKYANRACHIKNSPLPNRFLLLEEDLLPAMPMTTGQGLNMIHLASLLEDHERQKEIREKKDKERRDKEAKRLAALQVATEEQLKKPGFQRLRSSQYDILRRKFASQKGTIPSNQVVGDDTLKGFSSRLRLTAAQLEEVGPGISSSINLGSGGGGGGGSSNPLRKSSTTRPKTAGSRTGGKAFGLTAGGEGDRGGGASPSGGTPSRVQSAQTNRVKEGLAKSSFASWLAAQSGEEVSVAASSSMDITTGDGGGAGDAFFSSNVNTRRGSDGLAAADAGRGAGEGEKSGGVGVGMREMSGAISPATVGLRRDRGGAAGMPTTSSAIAVSALADSAAAAAATTIAANSGAAARRSRRGDDYSMMVDDEEEDLLAVEEDEIMDEDMVGDEGLDDEDVDEILDEEDELNEDDEDDDEDHSGYDLLEEGEVPKLLARFKVNTHDTLAVFKACTQEDFKDVISLLPENTPLPASDKMTYLLARLEVNPKCDMAVALLKVATGENTMNDAVGPAVGCLMATFGTNMIASCIFDFEDPEDVRLYAVDERIELWGLQIPHNSVRPNLDSSVVEGGDAEDNAGGSGMSNTNSNSNSNSRKEGGGGSRDNNNNNSNSNSNSNSDGNLITWSSVDRLNMSIGLLYALCNHAIENGIRCGFCVPRPQLLKRWMQAGVRMQQIKTPLKLIYPQTAHDYEYYKASTVAWFMVSDVKSKLEQVLGILR